MTNKATKCRPCDLITGRVELTPVQRPKPVAATKAGNDGNTVNKQRQCKTDYIC